MRPSYILPALSTLSMVPIIAIAVSRWRALEAGARWIALGFVVYLAFTVVMFVMSVKGIPNRIVGEAVLPLAIPCLLWGFSLWQRSRVATLVVRGAIPVLVAIWFLVLFTADQTQPFSSLAFPVESLFLIAVAGYTLLVNGITAVDNPARQSWFWICAGTLLSSGVQATLHPVSSILFPHRPDLVLLAFNVHSAIDVVANLLIARGMWCQGTLLVSGGSSSSLASLRSF